MTENKRKRPAPKPQRIPIPSTASSPSKTRIVTIEGSKRVSVQEKLVGARPLPSKVLPPVASLLQPIPEQVEDGHLGTSEDQPNKKTQASAGAGTLCYCGKGVRSTQCRDCRQYELSCEACWIQNHTNNPFHWAHIWNADLGFFVKHDISAVDGGIHVAALGHYGKMCPNAGNSWKMTAVEANGIHATKLQFCGCADNPSVDSKFDQLMKAGYFPGSADSPRTAFAFDVVKRFHLASLESKTAALDYISCLRRLTDNSMTASVPDPYPAFLPASRMYRYLVAIVRSGHADGIDEFMPECREQDDMDVHCPTCPAIGINVKVDAPETPLWLRHIMQQQITLDGNFHTGHFAKNCDPNDLSLYNGKAHFPPDDEYRTYLKSVPLSKEKATCTYLKAVNRQDKKKFKNMDVTGTINAQCSHVFVISTVDMHHSERFANADAALARMLRKMNPRKNASVKFRLAFEKIDKVVTYDIACEYYVKIKARFRDSPDLVDVADIVDRIRWGIPALHVTGHKSDCTYQFGTAYMDCIGHFHGETAEAYWPSANKIGGHARQMNNGHRQDTLIDNANDWNWKKTVNMSWKAMPRQTTKTAGTVNSVYRHTTSKVPSQTAIYQRMLANLENFGSTQIPSSRVAVFFKEGTKIQSNQRSIRNACNNTRDLDPAHKTHKPAQYMACEVELETIWLPSDFTEAQRVVMGSAMISLASEELKWREGEAYDLLRILRTHCKGLSALEDRFRDVTGQRNRTIAGEQVLDSRERRDNLISDYNTICKAMESLGVPLAAGDDGQFPYLTVADTFMKSRRRERALGDSRRGDGMLYTRIGITAGSKVSHLPELEDNISEEDEEPESKRQRGIQMAKRAKRKPTAKRSEKDIESLTTIEANPANKNGWLWELRRPSNMTDNEMLQWEREGDRVQWARAEADMDRFQEHVEVKLAEFLRCIETFRFRAEIWLKISTKQPARRGFVEHAKKTSYMWTQMETQCRTHLKMAGYASSLEPGFDSVAYFEEQRDLHDLLLKEQGIEPRDKHAEAETFATARDESDYA
ncbi:hypothetical protein C8R43DRAFT_1103994 [Mycena crocata]|nr:hypothetical protein C8R43DRAFT_1103994 [Mycena crocata]